MQPIRIVRRDSEYAQSDGNSVIAAILGADQKERGLGGTRLKDNLA